MKMSPQKEYFLILPLAILAILIVYYRDIFVKGADIYITSPSQRHLNKEQQFSVDITDHLENGNETHGAKSEGSANRYLCNHFAENTGYVQSYINNYLYNHAAEKDAVLNLCEILYSHKYIKEAEPMMEQYIFKASDSNEIVDFASFELLRNIYLSGEDGYDKYEQFIAHLPETSELKPPVIREAAAYFETLGDLERAQRILTNGIEANPNDESLRTMLAEFYENNGDLETAYVEYSEAVHLEETSQGFFSLGKISLALGKMQLAESSFAKAVSLNPEIEKEINKLKGGT